MNFQDLLTKIKTIDEGAQMAPPSTPEIEECGGMMGMSPSAPKQSDSVTMNISMNGSGAGGIKDIINILKHIEGGGDGGMHHGDDDDEIVIGSPKMAMKADEEFENSLDGASDTEEFPVDMMLRTGNDLASKGDETLKVNGGGNPMQESLLARLQAHYEEVKSR